MASKDSKKEKQELLTIKKLKVEAELQKLGMKYPIPFNNYFVQEWGHRRFHSLDFIYY